MTITVHMQRSATFNTLLVHKATSEALGLTLISRWNRRDTEFRRILRGFLLHWKLDIQAGVSDCS